VLLGGTPQPFLPQKCSFAILAHPATKVRFCYRVDTTRSNHKSPTHTRSPTTLTKKAGMGLHDDSFAIRTLDGVENGGQIKHYYFWPSVVSAGQTDFYKKGPMGGETGISIQTEVFEPWYNAGSFEKQSFMSTFFMPHRVFQRLIPHLTFRLTLLLQLSGWRLQRNRARECTTCAFSHGI
jgi:hypothetical protein